jgi:16S rRNA (guanine527-N7)-methyltransferase
VDATLREKLHADLLKGARQLGLFLPEGAAERLLDYLALLEKWSRVHNLTAIRDPREILVMHIMDSLAVAPHVAGPRIADIGSGAGLPGIPLAAALPDFRFTLLESRGKKAEFLRHAVATLGLANISVVQERVEAYRPPVKFDTLVARAFAPLPELVAACRHLLASGGRLVALKGRQAREELRAFDTGEFEIEVIPLKVPMLSATRNLIVLRAAP